MNRPILGLPGMTDEKLWTRKSIFAGGGYDVLPGGGYINCTKSRDPFNTNVTGVLQPGLLIGQVGTTKRWATSFFGKTTAAVAVGATSVTVGAVEATEIVRRVGSTGSLRIVGPPVSGAPAQVGTLVYSAVNTTTGVLTVSATGVNEVQTGTITGTPTAGTFRIGLPQPDDSIIWTATIAYNATFATVLASINTALDTAFGSSRIVATGAAYTAITFTFSGAGYLLKEQPLLIIDVDAYTGATGYTMVETTKGSYGKFIAGSLIGDTDGSHVPKSLIPPGYGQIVVDGDNAPALEQLAILPIAGIIDPDQIAPTVTDASILKWIAEKMGPANGGKFSFMNFYND